MARGERRRLFHKARTAAQLPGRVVACEDRCSALETNVGAKIDEMRAELAEIRALLDSELKADEDATELMGRLLQKTNARLEALEELLEDPRSTPLLPELRD